MSFTKQQVEELNKFGRWVTKNGWDADDLVQEAAAKSLEKYGDQENVALYKQMMKNGWIDIMRKRSREWLVDQLPEERDLSGLEYYEEVVDQLLSQLTEKQAVLFFLKESFHYQTKELASMFQMSDESVKALLHRARRRLNQPEIRSIDPIEPEVKETLERMLVKALQENDPTELFDELPKLHLFPSLSKSTSFSPMCLAA
ncbi:sigma factor-like helix-turn-helix DNA-binding protein [Halobacillus salinus]|uniref:RNA polymerase sigma factor 70 region 4 type 2 domain-containing protein n=1 Tax=Halobacillus salinus TaxID=192814 RepID=A0A4Z0GWI4_9BACI|nr:sigma factor-like helix-turn-helix DNA-binding protein [Halobacillus salinus]TGB01660.1 hypothetical protein E4663_16015 [Halobacillus salinus]